MMEEDADKPENISDENSNTIKCGVSDEVVTMDINWKKDIAVYKLT